MIVYGNLDEWYDIVNALATVACEIIILVCLNRIYEFSNLHKIFQKNIDKSKKNGIFSKIATYVLSMLLIFIFFSVSEKVTPNISHIFLKTYDSNYFANILVVPVLAFFLALLVKIEPMCLMDVTALCCCGSLILFKIGCSFAGCCYGVVYDGIFYNARMEEYRVPVELIELSCAIVMFAILMCLFKKRKMDGKLFPLFMIMYCGSRFVSEFWRDDYPAVVGRMTGYHIQCIVGFGLGLLYMIIALVFGKKINSFIKHRNEVFVKKMVEKLPSWKKKHPTIWEMIKFQASGLIASGFEIMVHMLFVDIIFYYLKYTYTYNPILNSIGIESIGYFWAFSISTAIGYSIGFVLVRRLVFVNDSNPTKSMIKYAIMVVFTVFACGWIGSALQAHAQQIGFTGTIEDVIVKIISMNIPFFWTYPLNKFVIHKDKIFTKKQ